MMSTSAADHIFASSQILNCFKRPDDGTTSKYWNNSQIVATASTDSFWEDDPEEAIKKQIVIIKNKFHQDRKLLVKHLPRNVTEDEISELLSDFPLRCIHLTNNDDTSAIATVTLEDPEMLDDWDIQKTFLLRGQSVFVSPTHTEILLCVARLPFNYTEDEFYKLIRGYGEIKMYFLMISEKTGKSKGYGFVQYTNKETALSARNSLNDKIIDTFRIVCDWLNSSHLTFKSLHSTCLYVDKLPKNFKDMSEFRKIFSTIVKPPYCQIAIKNGCLQDWGLVEYLTPEDSELVQTSLNGYCCNNQEIRVSYYIPGVRAINLYLQLLNDTPSHGKSTGLLPEPTGQSVMMSIQNLSKQNPVFAHNLRNIIFNQIQESKMGGKESSTVDNGKQNSVKHKKFNGIEKQREYKKTAAALNGGTKDLNSQSTPTIINNLSGHPVINPNCNTTFLSATSAPAPTHSMPLMPNTAIPPPLVEKLNITPPLNTVSLSMQNKPPCVTSHPYWNDVLGHVLVSTAGFTPFITSPIYTESSNHTFLPPPTAQITPNFMHEMASQQNIFTLLNGSTSINQALPNLGPMAGPHAGIFSYSPLSAPVDPSWMFTGAPEPLMSPSVHQHLINQMSLVGGGGKPLYPISWTPIPVVPSAMGPPTVFTNGEWPSRAVSVPVSSQPSTPLSQTGQKRKFLPSPEVSPEGNYIGQHSQGIGGHYAESYFKKKRMQ